MTGSLTARPCSWASGKLGPGTQADGELPPVLRREHGAFTPRADVAVHVWEEAPGQAEAHTFPYSGKAFWGC